MSDISLQKQPLGGSVTEIAPSDAIDLSGSPYGALLLAGISVVLMILGWLAFYFFLFMARGPIG